MTIYKEYFDFTPTTAQYGNDKNYPIFGLIGETMEAVEAMDLYYFDQTARTRKLLKKELGDMCYYLSQNCHHKNLSFEGLFLTNFNIDFETNRYITIISAIKVLAEQTKKIIRDGLSDKREMAISTSLSILAEYVEVGATTIDCSIEEILTENKNKLTDRKERGKIQGDGDNR